MIERDSLVPELEPEVPPCIAHGPFGSAEQEGHERDEQPAVGERTPRGRAAYYEDRANHDHRRADPDRDPELRAPQPRRVDDVEYERPQRPEHAADRVVGGLTGGVPEPPVDRARLDEVEDVPGRPEQIGARGRPSRAVWYLPPPRSPCRSVCESPTKASE